MAENYVDATEFLISNGLIKLGLPSLDLRSLLYLSFLVFVAWNLADNETE